MGRLPMFPLGSVLLPGAVLPLQVFEPRYLQLLEDCLAGTPEFGVVLIARGSEVGGGDVRTDVGTVARIVAAQEVQPGLWQLIAVGTDRFRVQQWLEDDPYPLAVVEPWDDPAPGEPPTEPYQRMLATARRVMSLAAQAGVPVGELTEAVLEDPRLGTFEVAATVPFGPLDRQRLLATEGAAARVALLEEQLVDVQILIEAHLES